MKAARNLTGVLLALGVAFSQTGCTSAQNNNEPTESTLHPVTDTVVIAQMQFNPAELTVHKGDKIVFVNRDMVTHNVTEETSKAWASPMLPVNESWTMEAIQSADYYCALHPVMKGKIIVQ